jgi:hypothetical protein
MVTDVCVGVAGLSPGIYEEHEDGAKEQRYTEE